MIPYAKTPQTNEQIVAILKSRGLAFDEVELLAFLAKVGYYRLKGYLVPFRQTGQVDFLPGADFAAVKAVYDFDANLRMVSGRGLAIVEVAVRAAVIRNHLARKPDPFLYKDAANLPGLKVNAYQKLMAHIADAVAKSRAEPFIRHLAVEHGIVDYPPLWTLMEVIPFGTLATYCQGLPPAVQRQVANSFSLTPSVFDILSVVRHMVKIVDPQSSWLLESQHFVATAAPFVLSAMGFPADWQKLALWQ